MAERLFMSPLDSMDHGFETCYLRSLKKMSYSLDCYNMCKLNLSYLLTYLNILNGQLILIDLQR